MILSLGCLMWRRIRLALAGDSYALVESYRAQQAIRQIKRQTIRQMIEMERRQREMSFGEVIDSTAVELPPKRDVLAK